MSGNEGIQLALELFSSYEKDIRRPLSNCCNGYWLVFVLYFPTVART